MSTRRDWTTDLGLLVVGVAAAILTFTTLRDLAEQCGITGTFLGLRLSYLVPVTVDAAGVVAARVWLKRTGGPDAVRFGRTLAWACIGASILGNAGQHGMAAYGIAPPWWVVVLVSAVPPATLGAVVHLGHLTRRTVEADPVRTTLPTERTTPDRVEDPLVTPGPVAEPEPVERTVEDLAEDLRRVVAAEGSMPSREKVRLRYGIGSRKADRVRALVTESDQGRTTRTEEAS